MKTLTFIQFLLIGVISAGMMAACSSDEAPQPDVQPESEAGPTTTSTRATSASEANILTPQEEEEGWILLFDGETTEGWRGYNKDSFPGAWTVEDGALKFNGDSSEEGGDILYDEMFGDFHLKLEWKISKGGNSGIFYLAQEIENTPIWQSAPEFQILDNENHPDADRGRDDNRKSASLYDLIPADPQNSNPFGEWNQAEILVHRGTVVHFQNGEAVLEYEIGTEEWNEMVANSKFAEMEEFATNETGYIALQDHSDDVWFRNIKLKKLN